MEQRVQRSPQPGHKMGGLHQATKVSGFAAPSRDRADPGIRVSFSTISSSLVHRPNPVKVKTEDLRRITYFALGERSLFLAPECQTGFGTARVVAVALIAQPNPFRDGWLLRPVPVNTGLHFLYR